MCGILCLLQYDKSVDENVACNCLNYLENRGPDMTSHSSLSVNEFANLFMGFTRLAIMDVTIAGQQPFSDSDGNVVICNGEIYNYKNLLTEHEISTTSHCDCEILLPLYKKVGFYKMIENELDAEFAIILYSESEKKLYVARDRYGVRPLYYGYNTTTQTFGFASELKALHDVMEYVVQLPPNCILTIDLSVRYSNIVESVSKYNYYNYDNLQYKQGLNDVNYIQEQINCFLTEAVRKRLQSDRPVGFLLSGGLDSSLIVAIASRILGPDNITCFSVGCDGSPDVEAAKKVVQYLGITKHHIIPFSLEEGYESLTEVIRAIETYDVTTIRASTPQYLMAKYIANNTDIRVLLSGEGSDEIHGSYRYFRNSHDPNEFHNETIRLLCDLYLFDNKRTDRTTAAHGLEVRVPFLDFAYVEFITSINPYLLMYRPDYMEKKILRDSFVGYLPDEILYRSKEAFSDAVSSEKMNWAQSLRLIAQQKYSDHELNNIQYEINQPLTLDALYFRKIFETIYPNRDNILPYYWLPRFQNTEVVDPSALVLSCY